MLRSTLAKADLTNTAILGTAGASWAVLIVWTNSPYAVFLGHSELGDVTSLLQLLPLALLFSVGWTFMLFAMAIPAAMPFVAQLRLRTNRGDVLVASLVGYLAIWVLFGLTAYFSDLGVHQFAELPPFQGRTWMLGSSVMILAAGYQFTATKDRLLKDCCYPSDFIQSHWKGPAKRFSALRLGLRYGRSSVGSCWAVILLMFALGLGSVMWMAVFALVMVAEASSDLGPRVRIPIGVILAGFASYSLLAVLGA